MSERPSHRGFDLAAIALVAVASLAVATLVPDWPLARLADPSYFAVVAYVVTLVVVAGFRIRRGRGTRSERGWLTGFLVGMPLIYIGNWVRYGEDVRSLLVEVAGFFAFAALAYAAARGRTWLLAAGIAGHGLWDLAHYGRSGFVPDWYALGCAIVDGAVAVYVTAQLPAWAARATRRKNRTSV